MLDVRRTTALGCGCVVVPFAFIWTLVVAGTALTGDLDVASMILLIVLFLLLPLGVVFGLMALAVRRTQDWIEGTVLVRQRVFRTTRIDLAEAAEIYTDSLPDVRAERVARVPILVIRDHAAGTVRLPLRTSKGWLPPGQLLALAQAIGQTRRPEPARQPVLAVASWLHQLATDPQARVW